MRDGEPSDGGRPPYPATGSGGGSLLSSVRDRSAWIARNLLPHEATIRSQLRRWGLPDDLDEDDVIQEMYSRFVTLPDLAVVHHPRSYALSTARSVLLMHIRRAKVVSIRAVDDLDTFGIASEDPSPEEQVSDREQLQLLATAVSALPEPNRRVFLLRMVDELPHREIGRRLGLSDNAVQKSIARSLAQLLSRVERGGKGRARASSVDETQAISGEHDETRDQR